MATTSVNININLLDNATKRLGNLFGNITSKLKNFNAKYNILAPRINTKNIQTSLDSLNMKRAEFSIANSVSTVQKKISTLNAGNAPNQIQSAFQSAFQKIRSELPRLQKAIENAANVTLAVQGMEQFGKTILSALKTPIAAGMDFEQAMSNVSAVTLSGMRQIDTAKGTNLAGEALDELTAKARELGSKTAWSATQIAQGMGYLGMTGMKAKEIQVAMSGLADLASAGAIDLARAADIASNIATTFFGDQAAGQMQRMADVMSHTISSFNVDVSMLGETMKYAAPVAKEVGFSFEGLAAATGILGNSGIQASMAGTTLRKTLLRLADPPERAQAALNELGVSTFKMVDGKKMLRDFPDILEDIAKASEGMGTATKAGLFADITGLTAISGFSTLVRSAGKGEFQKAITEMGSEGKKVAGKADSIAQERLNNLKGRLTILGSVMEALRISIYNTIKPILKVIVNDVIQIVGAINDWVQRNELLVSTLMKIGGVIGGATLAIGAFLKGIAAVRVVIIALRVSIVAISSLAVPLIAIAAVGLLIYKNWLPLKAFFAGFWQGLVTGLAPVAKAFTPIITMLKPVVQWFQRLATPVTQSIASLQEFTNIGQRIGLMLGQILNAGISSGMGLITSFALGVKQGASIIYNAVLSVFTYVWQLFTHSPAEKGPFARIVESGMGLIISFALGVKRAGPILWNGVLSVFLALSSTFTTGFDVLKTKFTIFLASLFSFIPSRSIINKQAWQIAKRMNDGFSVGSKKYLSPAFKQVWSQLKTAPLDKFAALSSKVAQVLANSFLWAAPALTTFLMLLLKTTSKLPIFIAWISGLIRTVTGLSSTFLTLTALLLKVAMSFRKFLVTVGGFGTAAYFVYSFRTELQKVGSDIQRLDFRSAFGGIQNIFSQLFISFITGWNSVEQKMQGNIIGTVMTKISGTIKSVSEKWSALSIHVQNAIKWFVTGFTLLSAAIYKIPVEKVVMFTANIGRAISALSPLTRGVTLLVGVVAKAVLIIKNYPEQVGQFFDFMGNTIAITTTKVQEFGNWITKIPAFSFFEGQTESFLMLTSFLFLPFGKVIKILGLVMYVFDLFSIQLDVSAEAARKFSLVMGGAFALPIVTAFASVGYALYTFKDEIFTILQSTVSFWTGAWAKFPAPVKAGIIILASLAGIVGAIAVGFISIPTLIAGAIAGGFVALASYKTEILNWWDELAGVFQVGVMLIGAVVIARLAIIFMRIRKAMAAQAKAKLCAKNPMLACMLPDKKELANRIKAGQSGWQLMGNNCATGACTEKAVADTSKIAKLQKGLANQATRFHKKAATTISSGYKTGFASFFSWIANKGKQASNTLTSGLNYKTDGAKSKGFTIPSQSIINAQAWQVAKQMNQGFSKGSKKYLGPAFKQVWEQLKTADTKKQQVWLQQYQKTVAVIKNSTATTSNFIKGKWSQATGFVSEKIKAANARSKNSFANLLTAAKTGTTKATRAIGQGWSKTTESIKAANAHSKMSFANLFTSIKTGAISARASLKNMHPTTTPTTGGASVAPQRPMGMGKGAAIGAAIGTIGVGVAAAGAMFSGSAEAAQFDSVNSSIVNVTQSVSLLTQGVTLANNAWTWMQSNVELLMTGGMLLLSTGLIDLGMLLSKLAPAAALAASAFAGWQVGLSLVSGKFFEITTAIQSFLDSVLSGLGGVAMAIPNFLGNILMSVGQFIGNIIGAIVTGNWADIGPQVVTLISSGFSAVWALVTALGSGIIKMLVAGVTKAIGTVTTVGSSVAKAIGSGITAATGFAVQAVTALLSVLVNKAKEMVKGIGSAITTGIKGSFNKAIGAVKGAMQKIDDFLPASDAKTGPLSNLTKSGSALLSTFIKGFVSAQPKAEKTITSGLNKTIVKPTKQIQKRAWEIARKMAGGKKGSKKFYKKAYAQAQKEFGTGSKKTQKPDAFKQFGAEMHQKLTGLLETKMSPVFAKMLMGGISKALPKLPALGIKIAEKLSDGFTKAKKSITGLFVGKDSIFNKMGDFLSPVKKEFQKLAKTLSPYLAPVKKKFQQLAKTLSPYLAPVGKKIKSAFNAVADFAAPVLKPIKAKFSTMFGDLFKTKDKEGFVSKIGNKLKGLTKKFAESDIGKAAMPVAKDFLVGSMEGGKGLLPSFLGQKAGAMTKLLPKFMRKSAGGMVSKEGMGSLAGVVGNKLGISSFGGGQLSQPTAPGIPTVPTLADVPTMPTMPTVPTVPTTLPRPTATTKNIDSSVKKQQVNQPITINVTVNVDNKDGKLDEKKIGDIVAKKIAERQTEARAEARRSSFDY